MLTSGIFPFVSILSPGRCVAITRPLLFPGWPAPNASPHSSSHPTTKNMACAAKRPTNSCRPRAHSISMNRTPVASLQRSMHSYGISRHRRLEGLKGAGRGQCHLTLGQPAPRLVPSRRRGSKQGWLAQRRLPATWDAPNGPVGFRSGAFEGPCRMLFLGGSTGAW